MSRPATRTGREKPIGRREAAALERERRRRRRQLQGVLQKTAIVLGVLAIAAVLVYAYQGAIGADKQVLLSDMQNKPAPEFTLPTSDGADVSLTDFAGKKNLLLYFNEGYG